MNTYRKVEVGSSKKILVVSVNFFVPENLDGINKINYNLLNNSQNYHADFLSLNPIRKGESFPTKFENVNIHEVSSRSGFNNKLINKLKWLFETKPFTAIGEKSSKELASYIEKTFRNYDIIHLSGFNLAPVINHLSNESRKKVLFAAIDSPSLFYSRRFRAEKNILKKLIWAMETRKCLRYEKDYYHMVPKVLFVSNVDKKHVLNKIPKLKNVVSVPNGVDTKYYAPMSGKRIDVLNKKMIIFTGNFNYSPNKNAAFFLIDEVLPILKKKMPEISLVLAGGYPPKSLKNREDDSVTVTGFVDDLRPYLHNATIFVSPISFGSGIKNKVLEAMSLGMIIVGSKISFEGIEYQNMKHCIVQSSFSPLEWASKIFKVFQNYDEFKVIGTNATQLIQMNYSWHSVQKRYSDIYDSIIENS